jgi:GcrA cell cycle regulator
MAWTDERVELLKKLWQDGLSASQIARQMGDVTRNAVIGKVHRLGLSGRANSNRPQRARNVTVPKPVAKPVMVRPTLVEEPVVLDNGEHATVMTIRDGMCKWPIGDPATAEFRFCGRRTAAGASYCEGHAQMAYQPARDRSRDRRKAS